MKKNILKTVAVGMAACALVACSNGTNNAGAREETTAAAAASTTESTETASKKVRLNPYDGETEIKIAYIAHDISTPNNQGWLEGIKRECAAWDNISIIEYNADSSAETQVTQVADAVNQGCQAIILQCSDGTALASAVDDAEAAGVPVVTMNLDAYTTHSALVMAVDYDAGRMAADEMAKQMGEKGKVVIIEGVAGLTRTVNLEKGF